MSDLVSVAYNPDVLSCLANLSNDEVFTPPDVVNEMLDMLPPELFTSKATTFLDPACKSGVFLREIAKRLLVGLRSEIPDLQRRIDHIFRKQLYGIAITELTSLLSRRSVYCSKYPNGAYSVTQFDDAEGNIRFRRTRHAWVDGRCQVCGAASLVYDRGDDRESHAYEFIHESEPEGIFDMQFDVIIGNPPYQLSSNDNRNTSRDRPIYNLFVEQAMKLKPRYLVMIIPSRWMASGLGLTGFRQTMLSDRRIRSIFDYPVASEVFPGVEVKGGVCYFLWDRDKAGDCEVTTIRDNSVYGPVTRMLDEFDVFVRDSRALSILAKVREKEEPSVVEILSVDKEFGWTSNFNGFHEEQRFGDIPIYYNRFCKRLQAWVNRGDIKKSTHLIDKWKVMVPKAGSDGGQRIPDTVLGRSFVVPSPSVCTQTYLFFYSDTKSVAHSIDSYIHTRFLRFLVSLRKNTQDATRSTYTWVPQQSWDEPWTDERLYAKYGLTEEEIAYIEGMIRPMDPIGAGDGE
jgi:site-specific DNA-methyltransferase (adenine-specific)